MKRFLTLGALVALAACTNVPQTGEQQQNDQQAQAVDQAVQSVGMPGITHFTEKRQLKTIYELRDQAISTFSYTQDLNGRFHLFCHSVGYGIPYSTQYTNPSVTEQHYESAGGNVVVPQADPNALYSPPQAAGTWIMCLEPGTKKVMPQYVEPNVVVTTFQIPGAN